MAKQITPRKQQLTYYFSVEGETEYWYLEWLEAQINGCTNSKYNVKFKAKIEKDPISYAKSLVIQKKTTVWHLSDIEGSTQEHVSAVQKTIGRLKDVKKVVGKDIVYRFGYSNLSFDLWMVLHKMNCNAQYPAPGRYLPSINQGYQEQFESMKKYKEEDNFKRCLRKLTLDEVHAAIRRAKEIMRRNAADGYPLTKFKGYEYYIHNPALEIYEPVEQILKDCGLL